MGQPLACQDAQPKPSGLAPQKDALRPALQLLALPPGGNSRYQCRLPPAHPPRHLIPLDPEAFIKKALELLASERYFEKGMGLMALTGRRPAEIFYSASFSLPKKKLPYPALFFSGQLKTRNAPGTSFEPYPIPVLAEPKLIIRALERLRSLRSFSSADAVNTTTSPHLPGYVSAAFGSLDQPWKPGYLRSHLLPQVQAQKHDRRHLPGTDPRTQTPRA